MKTQWRPSKLSATKITIVSLALAVKNLIVGVNVLSRLDMPYVFARESDKNCRCRCIQPLGLHTHRIRVLYRQNNKTIN